MRALGLELTRWVDMALCADIFRFDLGLVFDRYLGSVSCIGMLLRVRFPAVMSSK